MENVTCPICGAPRKMRAKTCGSKNCQYKLRMLRMPECVKDGCDRPVISLSAGLCGSHYSTWYRANKAKHTYTCDWCGVEFTTGRKAVGEHVFCCGDHSCKWVTQDRVERYWASKGTDLVLWRAPKPGPRVQKVQHVRGPGLWTSGKCRVCGELFVSSHTDVTCSEACRDEWRAEGRRRGKQVRRARKVKAFVAPVYPSKIYARDGYMCWLCGGQLDMVEKVPHPLAPTIDHVIPLARGGWHEPGNIKAAHFLCNAKKSDNIVAIPAIEMVQESLFSS